MRKQYVGALGALLSMVACGGGDEPAAHGAAGDGAAAGQTAAGSSAGGVSGGGNTSAAGGNAGGGGSGGGGSSGASGGGSSGASGGGSSGASGGGDGGSGSGQGGQATTPAALMPIVTAFCAAARSCCQGEDEADVDLVDCEAEFGMKNPLGDALERGAVTLESAGLEMCRAAYEAAAGTCEQVGVLAACKGLVHGTIADGAVCRSGSECAAAPGPNTCLITEPNGKEGICKPVPHAKAGDACFFTARKGESYDSTTWGKADSLLDLCFEDEGLFCDQDSEPPKCQPLRAAGADCDDDDQCGSDGYCDYGGDGKCKKRGKLDEACGICIPQLSCISGKCKSPSFAVGNTCLGYSLGPY